MNGHLQDAALMIVSAIAFYIIAAGLAIILEPGAPA